MTAPFIEVNLPYGDPVTMEYSLNRLLSAPIELAETAIAQQEAAYMERFISGQVMEDIIHLLMVDALYPKTLDEHFRSKKLGELRCTHVSNGRADWIFRLICEECSGSGTTYTMSNKRVGCPDCSEGGTMAEAFFATDLSGRFIGWNTDVRGAVMNYGHGPDTVSLIAMDQDHALSIVAGWWS